MRVAALALLLSVQAAADELPAELQLGVSSLRSGERARLEKALGPLGSQPLYRAELKYDPGARTVTGKVVVTYTPKGKALDELYLRAAPNAAHANAVQLGGALVNGKPAKVLAADASTTAVVLDKPAPADVPLVVELTLKATVPRASAQSESLSMGEGGGDYGAYSAAPEITSLAGLLPGVVPLNAKGEPMAGPSGIGDLGSFEPAFYVVSLAVPSGYRVVAPGNLVGEVPERGGTSRFTYAVAGARDFPLLVTKGYAVETRAVGEVVVESHFLQDDKASGLKVLEHAAAALKELEARLGPYPFTRLRVVEQRLEGGAGGMEFPGLVTVGTALYRGAADPLAMMGLGGLSDPMFESLFAGLKPMLQGTLEFTVDHEVAHQYFAMLVGSDPVDEPVTDEPLAQHTALLVMEWRHGKKTAEEARGLQLKTGYQVYRLMGGADGVVNRPTGDFDSNQQYAALMYGKAPMLYDEVRKRVGEEAWTRALRTYVDEYRYRWARPGTLLGIAARQRPGDAAALEQLRKRWWEEKHADQDIGTMDLGDLSGLGLAGGGAPGVDPAQLEEIEKLMKQLSGQ